MAPSRRVLWLLAIPCFLLRATSAALVTATGSTVELGGIPYYVSSKPVASAPSSCYTQALAIGMSMGTPWIPVTVVKATPAAFGVTELQNTLKTFGETDDVWTTAFLSSRSSIFYVFLSSICEILPPFRCPHRGRDVYRVQYVRDDCRNRCPKRSVDSAARIRFSSGPIPDLVHGRDVCAVQAVR